MEILLKQETTSLRSELRKNFDRERHELLPALHYVHEQFGFLPEWALEITGWHLGIPLSEVYGAASSYTELNLAKREGTLIKICSGLSCQSSGSEQLMKEAREKFENAPNTINRKEKITLETIDCAYVCAVAPVVQIKSHILGHATLESITATLRTTSDHA